MNESIREMVRSVPLFSGFTEEELEHIYRSAVRRQVHKGVLLFHEGDPADAMYILVEGRTRSFTSDAQGREFVFMIGEPGITFGEISLLDDEPRSWSTQAEEDSVFLMFNKADFRAALQQFPHLKDMIVRNLARMVRHLSSTMKNLALLDVYGRLRALLESLTVVVDGQPMINEPLTQQAIADRVGSSREMIARILKELVFGGYIRLENKKIIILQKLPERF